MHFVRGHNFPYHIPHNSWYWQRISGWKECTFQQLGDHEDERENGRFKSQDEHSSAYYYVQDDLKKTLHSQWNFEATNPSCSDIDLIKIYSVDFNAWYI